MKRIALTFIAAVMAISNITAQTDGRSRTLEEIKKYYSEKLPDDLMTSITNLVVKYGIDNDISITSKTNPESGRIISTMATIPFSSAKAHENIPMEDITSKDMTTKAATDFEQLITEIKSKFQACMNLAYTIGNIKPGDPHTNIVTLTGDNQSDEICILSQGESAFLIYMEIKDAKDPEMRDFYAMKWQNQLGSVYGTIYLIKSKRPDLVLKEQQAASSNNSKSIEEEMMNHLDDSDRLQITLLGELIDQYDRELSDLYDRISWFDDKKMKKAIEKQIDDVIKKRQETLDKMHHLLMNIDF